MTKKVATSLRIDPALKAMADEIAKREHRSFTNLIETLILERGERHGLKAEGKRRRLSRG